MQKHFLCASSVAESYFYIKDGVTPRLRGELLDSAFGLQQNTVHTHDLMVWSALTHDTRSPLLLMDGTLATLRWVQALFERQQGFQQTRSAPYSKGVTRIPPPYYNVTLIRSIPRFVPHTRSLRTADWATSNLAELELGLQNLWNEMTQDTMGNLINQYPPFTHAVFTLEMAQ